MKTLYFILLIIIFSLSLFFIYLKTVREDIYDYCGFKVVHKELIGNIETKYKYYIVIESPQGIQKDIFITDYDYFHISVGEVIKCYE